MTSDWSRDLAISVIDSAARVCHEANRAFCQTWGDFSEPEWGQAPDWQKDAARKGVMFHFSQYRAGRDPLASATHEIWLEQKRVEGWKYGPIKAPEQKEHPFIVPYDQLPAEERRKDYIFGAICKAFWLSCEADEPENSLGR